MESKKYLIKYSMILIIFVLLAYLSVLIVPNWMYFGGDSHFTVLFGKNLAENIQLKFSVEENSFLDSPIIGVRGHGISNNQVIPAVHLGMVFLVAIFYSLNILVLLPVVFGLLFIWYSYNFF